MHDSKLIQSIKVLTKEEIEGVKQLLSTDLLLKGSYKAECMRLLEYIINLYPDFRDERLERHLVLKEIFKGENSKINRLEKTMSALLNVVDFYILNFILVAKIDIVNQHINLSKFYRNRGYKNRCNGILKKVEKHLYEPIEILDSNYYDCLFRYEDELKILLDIVGNEYNENDFWDLINILEEQFFVKTLEKISRIAFRKFKVSENVIASFKKLEIEINKKKRLAENPLILLFSQSIQMLYYSTTKDFIIYYNIFFANYQFYKQKLTKEYTDLFAKYELIAVTNLSNTFLNNKNQQFLFKISKRQIDEKLWHTNGVISNQAIISIVTQATNLKEIAWIESFIIKWNETFGHPHEREQIVHYCWAVYYFLQQDYIKAESYLLPKYENLLYNIQAKRLQMKIYYEVKEDLVLSYQLESFKVYIHRLYKQDKINEIQYNANNLFCNKFKQLYELRYNPDEKTKERLYKKVEEQNSSEKAWLLEKIEEIKVPYTKL